MNKKQIIGFITGVLIVSGLWFFLSYKPGNEIHMDMDVEKKKIVTCEINDYQNKKTLNTPTGDEKNINKKDAAASSDKKVMETREKETDEKNDEDEATGQTKKQFFWKPFSLQAKAHGFAKQISTASKVPCLFEKISTGKYRVYFTYNDETDRKAKTIMIEDIGIRPGLDTDNNN